VERLPLEDFAVCDTTKVFELNSPQKLKTEKKLRRKQVNETKVAVKLHQKSFSVNFLAGRAS
jgi:hypothetical protein